MLRKPRPAASSSLRRQGSGGCKQLERVAGWVGTGLYTAFFTSLDRCACVKLDTIEMQEPMMGRQRARAEQSSSSKQRLPAAAKPHHSSRFPQTLHRPHAQHHPVQQATPPCQNAVSQPQV